MYELHALGFGPDFEEQLPDGNPTPARIASEHRDGYTIWCSAGEYPAQVSGRLAYTLRDEDYPGVGDWVVLRTHPSPGESCIIDHILPRRTLFTRGAAGHESRNQVIAANVDIVFIVCGLDADFNVHRIQRYLVRVSASGARPIVVLNKSDLCDDIDGHVSEVERAAQGTPVFPASARLGHGLDKVSDYLRPGVTAAFVGSSGAGKSTLINALLGEERFRTGEVRTGDSHGRHTTSHREMVMFPCGGLLIDTPGMRELALFDQDGINAVFPYIEELALHCRFRDCSHTSEPGCAVRHAVESGEIMPEHVDHYLTLQAEARSNELRRNERLRRKQEKVTGRQRAKDVKLIKRLKEGR